MQYAGIKSTKLKVRTLATDQLLQEIHIQQNHGAPVGRQDAFPAKVIENPGNRFLPHAEQQCHLFLSTRQPDFLAVLLGAELKQKSGHALLGGAVRKKST